MELKLINSKSYSLGDAVNVYDGEEHILTLGFSDGDTPQKTDFILRFANGNSFSVWSPNQFYKRFVQPTWCTHAEIETDANHGIPMIQFIDKKGNNILIVALSDVHNPIKMRSGIDERTGLIEIKISIFTKKMPPVTGDYKIGIYSSDKNVPYYEAISSAMDYLCYKNNTYPMGCPEFAKKRTYSSWYAFQKDITAAAVVEQAKLAKKYGMDTMILDDGWQTPCSQGDSWAYNTCGDWENYKPKFPDMRKFSDDIHSLDMRLILWFATPFIGSESKEFEFFKGKLLRSHSGDGKLWIADPRFAEVRSWYVNKLLKLITEWNLDGFKLDFIDCFTLSEDSSHDYTGMDIPNLGFAVEKLTEEIRIALQNIKPDVVLEFRQAYIGPAMQKNGNMIRVCDCAYGSFFNRINGIDLRLISGRNAVHSDMLMWDYNASPEGVADQLSNILFVVPQISMFFDKLNPSHRKVLKFYLDFIDENRDVLLDGKLVPLYPEACYSIVYAYNDNTLISALYEADSFIVPYKFKSIKIVNATGSDKIFVDLGENFSRSNKFTVYNCMGDIIYESSVSNKIDIYKVPHNGIIIFE